MSQVLREGCGLAVAFLLEDRFQELRFIPGNDRQQESAECILSTDRQQRRAGDGRQHTGDGAVVRGRPLADHADHDGQFRRNHQQTGNQHTFERHPAGQHRRPGRLPLIALADAVEV